MTVSAFGSLVEGYVRIGQLSEKTGVATRTLRFWEIQGLLPDPGRTAAGYRDYPPDAVDRVSFIRRAQASGLTLQQIRIVCGVADAGDSTCGHVADFVDQRLEDLDRRLRELSTTREALVGLRERLDGLDPRDCDPSDVCAALAWAEGDDGRVEHGRENARP